MLGVDYDENDPAYILTPKGDEVKDVQLSSWCSEWLPFRPFSFYCVANRLSVTEAMSKLMHARHYHAYHKKLFSHVLIDLLLYNCLLFLNDSASPLLVM